MSNKKLITKQLNLSSIDDVQIEYNKMFMILPTPIVDKLMNLNNYSNFKWFTNIKKSSVDDNHIKTLNRINKLIIILKSIYDKNKANDAGKYIYNFQYKKTDFRKLFSADACDTYMSFLADIGLVNKCEDSNYSAGKFAYTYRMSKELFEGQTYSMIFNLQKSYNVEDENEVIYTYYNSDVKIDNRMKLTLDVVKINKADAISDEIRYYLKSNNDNIESLAHRINNILSFGSKKYLTIGKKVNRLYHHITNLSSIARKHLNIKFNFVDITNCQPLLLAYTMKSNNCEVDAEYINDVENGSFYEQFMFLNSNRNQTKVSIYKNLFFGFNKNNETNELFKKLYPSVWEYLNQVNQNKDNSGQTLASILQNIETEIFSDVADVCQNSGYLFTLHDSIYFDNVADEQPVKEHLTNKFSEYGLQVRFNF